MPGLCCDAVTLAVEQVISQSGIPVEIVGVRLHGEIPGLARDIIID
ncbi:MAG: hypothetical protein MZV63_02845 [Marinilabiliales bacterium]|nr:hypothetical protein [Marinilabiliales bacterium]